MKPANKSAVNEDAKRRATEGIINPTARVIPQGTTLFRLASTYTKNFAEKGVDQRPTPESYPTLEAYDAADKQWMSDNSSTEAWARLFKGGWWFGSGDLVDFKYASMQSGVPLSDCGRQALAVASFWNNAEFLIEAKVKPTGGLEVFCGKGRQISVQDPLDGTTHHLVGSDSVLQFFIPGMHLIRNARAWFKLEHRHRLRHG